MIFVAANTGQLCAAVLLDHVGFASSPVRPVTPRRVLGVGLACIACVLMQLRGERVAPELAPLLAVCVAAGASLPVQSAINNRLASHIGGASSHVERALRLLLPHPSLTSKCHEPLP